MGINEKENLTFLCTISYSETLRKTETANSRKADTIQAE